MIMCRLVVELVSYLLFCRSRCLVGRMLVLRSFRCWAVGWLVCLWLVLLLLWMWWLFLLYAFICVGWLRFQWVFSLMWLGRSLSCLLWPRVATVVTVVVLRLKLNMVRPLVTCFGRADPGNIMLLCRRRYCSIIRDVACFMLLVTCAIIGLVSVCLCVSGDYVLAMTLRWVRRVCRGLRARQGPILTRPIEGIMLAVLTTVRRRVGRKPEMLILCVCLDVCSLSSILYAVMQLAAVVSG